ncbi:hypothetical protein [Glycomyces tritici]|uniref:DUF3592 domain-containing protein n=1 Tax=Glycomyces tritici TaxID=2665176 RepID=A0ABT7YPP7_9ACTN|nr:hypothetical protein [Glycomyces tritici]MDN3240578.1 hypothetical protein [Glycomyces tritici]
MLYLVSLVDYRFPTAPGYALLGGSTALLVWWCVRAAAIGGEDAAVPVSPKAQVRHRRMVLGISYAIVCAILSLASGVAGNDRPWHRFTDSDPQIVAAQVVTIDGIRKPGRSPWQAHLDGFAELGGTRMDFQDQRVQFDEDPRDRSASEIDAWAVFSPGDGEAGLVVVDDRSEAESLLDGPIVPFLPFGLVLMAVIGAIQHFRTRERRFSERRVPPIGALPGKLWGTIAGCAALIAVLLAWLHHITSSDGPFTTAHYTLLNGAPSIWVGVLLITAAAMLGAFFDVAAMHKGTESPDVERWKRRSRALHGNGSPRATGAEREAKRRKDRRKRKRKRDRN